MGYYGGSGNKEAKQKALLIQKYQELGTKYGTLDPEYTLITWDMKTNGVTRKTFETSKFMSSDIVAKPYDPMDRMDDHVKSVPALPVTSFFSDRLISYKAAPELTQLIWRGIGTSKQSQSQREDVGGKVFNGY